MKLQDWLWLQDPTVSVGLDLSSGRFLKTCFPTGSLSLAEVAAELNSEMLQQLKRECGGLQTLLRNSHQVFEGKISEVAIHCSSEQVPPCAFYSTGSFLSPREGVVILRGILDVQKNQVDSMASLGLPRAPPACILG